MNRIIQILILSILFSLCSTEIVEDSNTVDDEITNEIASNKSTTTTKIMRQKLNKSKNF